MLVLKYILGDTAVQKITSVVDDIWNESERV